MYSLYSRPQKLTAKQIMPTDLIDPLRRLNENINKITHYYRLGTFWTDTLHILTRLVTVMAVPVRYEPARYLSIVQARWHGEVVNLGFTTSYHSGKWHKGEFYHGCDEILFAYSSQPSLFKLERDWKTSQAVTVLDCPISNLGLQLPDGKERNSETGMAFIGIDITVLMMQYYYFMQDQMAFRVLMSENEVRERPYLGPKDFVAKYVIPNMLGSQTDVVLFNRLRNLHSGAPMGQALTNHTFSLLSPGGGLERGFSQVLKRVSSLKMRYRDLLEQIPRTGDSYPFAMPDMAETRQAYWALFLARLKTTEFLVDVGGKEGVHYNGTEINELIVDLRRFKSDNTYRAKLTGEKRWMVENRLTELMNTLK